MRSIQLSLFTLLSPFFMHTASGATLVLDDGGVHTIDFAVADGIALSNGTTVNIVNGATISAAPVGSQFAITGDGTSTVNLQGGTINSGVSDVTFNMTGGDFLGSVLQSDILINGGNFGFNMRATTGELAGGSFTFLEVESMSDITISGGTFNSGISLLSRSIEITGGNFFADAQGATLKHVDHNADRFDIKGGSYSGDFVYTNFLDFSYDTFVFFGDLTMSAPSLVQNSTYEAFVTGTLLDGSSVSQRVLCNELGGSATPCGGIQISAVPLPAAVWLFASGLLGLIGAGAHRVTRRCQ